MIVLDASVVTIALPSAQRALHISVANRQWALTAYTLAFGGLLLIGGRIADYFGRKRMFIISLLGFAGASALGGLAQNSAMLFGARALQGAFAAVMAPASLSLLTVTFTEPRERARAFGVYGAIAGGGAAIGLVLGGLLTDVRLVALDTADQRADRHHCGAGRGTRSCTKAAPRAASAATTSLAPPPSTLGLLSLVYGFTRAETDGWASPVTLSLLAVAAVLLVAFVLIERRSETPLLPLRVVLDRNRGGSFLASLLVGSRCSACFLFLTYYMQAVLGYSAVKTGFAFLPFSAGIIFSATHGQLAAPAARPPRAHDYRSPDGSGRDGLVHPDRGAHGLRDARPAGLSL